MTRFANPALLFLLLLVPLYIFVELRYWRVAQAGGPVPGHLGRQGDGG